MSDPERIDKKIWILGLGVYGVASLWFILYGYTPFSADTIAYFQLAKLYSHFDLKAALNAYWSPLLPWVLAPLLKIGFDAFTAFKIVNAIFGVFLLQWTYQLLQHFTLSYWVRIECLFAVMLIAIGEQLKSFTPDFISACLLIGFMNVLLRGNSWKMIAGLGLLLIFSKSIFLPIALLLLVAAMYVNRASIRPNSIAIGGILFVVFCWASLLSHKYDRLILNSSTAYNLELSLSQNGVHYNSRQGLIAPVEEGMIFSWQDPTYYPVDLTVQSNKVMRVLSSNLRFIVYFFFYAGWCGIALCALPYLAFYALKREERAVLLFLLIFIFISLSSYLLFMSETRYYIPAHLCWIVTCFYCFEKIKERFKYTVFLLILLTISLLKPAYYSVDEYLTSLQKRKEIVEQADQIALLVHEHRITSMASNSSNMAANAMALVAYRTQTAYYGELAYNLPTNAHETDLQDNNIELLCVFGKENLEVEKKLQPQINFISKDFRWYVLR